MAPVAGLFDYNFTDNWGYKFTSILHLNHQDVSPDYWSWQLVNSLIKQAQNLEEIDPAIKSFALGTMSIVVHSWDESVWFLDRTYHYEKGDTWYYGNPFLYQPQKNMCKRL